MKWNRLALAITVAFSANVQAQSLEQAVATALVNNPDIKQAFNSYQSYKSDIDVTKGAYRPTLDLNASIGKENTDSPSTRNANTDADWLNARQATLTLRQLIWDGSTTINNIDRTEAEAEAARYQLLSDAQNKALEVAQAYIDVVLTQQLLALAEENLASHLRIQDDIQKRTQSGFGAISDLNQIETRVAQANSNLIAAQNNLDDAVNVFIFLVNDMPEDLVSPEVDVTMLPLTKQEAINRAREFNPIVDVAAYDLEATYQQKDMYDGSFAPTFAIEASHQVGDDLNGSDGSYSNTSALLTLNWNLFNGGADRANSEKMVFEIRKAQDVQENALMQLDESTKLAWAAYDLTGKQKAFLQKMVDAASATLGAYEKEYKIGKRTLLDLLNTENELYGARQSYITAEYDNIAAQYRVLNATGQLLDELRVVTPEEWHQPVVDDDSSSETE